VSEEAEQDMGSGKELAVAEIALPLLG